MTLRQLTESIFESRGLPGWLGWGTAGAESTYGTNGAYAFGGIDTGGGQLISSGGKSYRREAEQAAAAYKGLVRQYGSVRAAVPHYSGNSYTVTHVEELGKGSAGVAGGQAVPGAPGATSKAKTNAAGDGGPSGVMKFLLTAALVLGGFVLVGLGAMRSIGQRRSLEGEA